MHWKRECSWYFRNNRISLQCASQSNISFNHSECRVAGDGMWNLSYLELLQKFFTLDFKYLCPWKRLFKPFKVIHDVKFELFVSVLLKISRTFRFRAYLFLPLTVVLIMVSFIYFEWDSLSFTLLAENIAVTSESLDSREISVALICDIFLKKLVLLVHLAILVKKFYRKYQSQLSKLLDDRYSN